MASDSDLGSGAGFTSAAAARVMASACSLAGFDAAGADQLRFGENALYRLASVPVVVRVARVPAYLASARREVAVSRWLADEGFPAVRAVDDIDQPLMVDGHPVTFWRLIEDAGRPATYGELGAVLRDLHSLTPPPPLNLPPFDAFGRSDRRIAVAEGSRDLRDWPGFGILAAVPEFKMTTWLMQNVAEGPHVAEEVRARLASLRDEGAPRNWRPC